MVLLKVRLLMVPLPDIIDNGRRVNQHPQTQSLQSSPGLEVLNIEVNLTRMPKLIEFSNLLEEVTIETIEQGFMTKDLAICAYGWDVKERKTLSSY